MGKAPLLETRHLKKYFHVAAGTLHAVDDEAADRFLYQTMREPWKKEMYS